MFAKPEMTSIIIDQKSTENERTYDGKDICVEGLLICNPCPLYLSMTRIADCEDAKRSSD